MPALKIPTSDSPGLRTQTPPIGLAQLYNQSRGRLYLERRLVTIQVKLANTPSMLHVRETCVKSQLRFKRQVKVGILLGCFDNKHDSSQALYIYISLQYVWLRQVLQYHISLR